MLLAWTAASSMEGLGLLLLLPSALDRVVRVTNEPAWRFVSKIARCLRAQTLAGQDSRDACVCRASAP